MEILIVAFSKDLLKYEELKTNFQPEHKNLVVFTNHESEYLQNVQQFPTEPTFYINNKATPLYLLREPASLLVVTNTHPPLSLVYRQLSHPLAFTPLTLSHPTAQITLFT